MKATTKGTQLDSIPDTKLTKLKDIRLSPDGKWRSFPKVPNLVQYVNTGVYFGRVKIEGKIFRESLATDVFTTAKLLLGDWMKSKRKLSGRPVMGTFGEALALTHHDLRHLFATRCIESRVDIQTISRWLGHSDGGALIMKTYGHLRREHSTNEAQKVNF
jgi:integrase